MIFFCKNSTKATMYLRSSVLGAVDGTISSFAVVAGAHVHRSALVAVLVIGISTVFADGLSMGVSEYLSASAQLTRDGIMRGRWQAARRSALSGALCFASFVVCGSVPLLSYAASNESLLSSAMFSLATLMALGAARSRASREPILHGLLQTGGLGALAGGVAYAAGKVADAWIV